MKPLRRYDWVLGAWFGVLMLASFAQARSVSCLLDLKFYEKRTGADADRFLGATSSRVKRDVSVPSNDDWYVRPVGRWEEADFFRLAREMRDFKIPGLDLSNRWDVTNDTLAIFQDVYALRVLMIARTRVTDAGLSHLEKLENLGYLSLNNQITDAGLRHLSGLSRLERIELRGSKVTDKGLSMLEGLARLKSLDVSETAVTDRGLEPLQKLARLEALFASRHLTDAGMVKLAGFNSLKYLDLSEVPVTDAGVATLAQSVPRLTELSLSGTRVTDAGLKALSQMKSLRLLTLSGTQITPEGLPALESLVHLETLSLPWDILAGPEIQAFCRFPHLKKVVLNNHVLTADQLARMGSMSRGSASKKEVADTLAPRALAGVVPATHPGRVTQTSFPIPSLSPQRPRQGLVASRDGRETSPAASMPADLTAALPVKTAIALEGASTGKGMELEFGARSAPRSTTINGVVLTGLRRIHQAEITQSPTEPELFLAESRQIITQQDNAANSLGEIEVNTRW